MTRLESSSAQELPAVFINGEISSQISVFDRAFQYGDGLFETLAVINGKPALLDLHLQRLKTGLSRLAFPELDFQSLREDILARATRFDSAVLKLVITRGESQRGYLPPPTPAINIVEFFSERVFSTNTTPSGISLCFCKTQLGINPQLAGIKHLNRLEQVLAKKESHLLGADDGLVSDIEGNIIEATSSNLFLYKEEKLLTPDLARCGINGVVRELVLSIAKRMDIPVIIQNVSRQDCLQADALFLSNSLSGITPVKKLENTLFPQNNWPRDLYREIMNHVYT